MLKKISRGTPNPRNSPAITPYVGLCEKFVFVLEREVDMIVMPQMWFVVSAQNGPAAVSPS